MRDLELGLLAGVGLPEHPALLGAARAYAPNARWPGRTRRRAKSVFVRGLRGVTVPLGSWVCHELHLRRGAAPYAAVSIWLERRVLPDRHNSFNACATSVHQYRGHLIAVVLMAEIGEQAPLPSC